MTTSERITKINGLYQKAQALWAAIVPLANLRPDSMDLSLTRRFNRQARVLHAVCQEALISMPSPNFMETYARQEAEKVYFEQEHITNFIAQVKANTENYFGFFTQISRWSLGLDISSRMYSYVKVSEMRSARFRALDAVIKVRLKAMNRAYHVSIAFLLVSAMILGHEPWAIIGLILGAAMFNYGWALNHNVIDPMVKKAQKVVDKNLKTGRKITRYKDRYVAEVVNQSI